MNSDNIINLCKEYLDKDPLFYNDIPNSLKEYFPEYSHLGEYGFFDQVK